MFNNNFIALNMLSFNVRLNLNFGVGWVL